MSGEAAVTARGPLRRFLHALATALDADVSLFEITFGLIMLIGATSASRFSFVNPEPDRRDVLVAACLLAFAWAIIDATFIVLAGLFREGRILKLARTAHERGRDPEDPVLLEQAHAMADGGVWDLLPSDEVERIAREVVRHAPEPGRAVRIDPSYWMQALATVIVMAFAAAPVVLPFLLPLSTTATIWASNALAVATLFGAGWFWARWTAFPRWAGGLTIAGMGAAAVGLTVLLDVA